MRDFVGLHARTDIATVTGSKTSFPNAFQSHQAYIEKAVWSLIADK